MSMGLARKIKPRDSLKEEYAYGSRSPKGAGLTVKKEIVMLQLRVWKPSVSNFEVFRTSFYL